MNYATHYLELAAIVHALKMWRHYLLGQRFELKIDHMSLNYLFDRSSLNAQQAIWLEFLSEFDIEIKHVKGKGNKVFDALSSKYHVAAMCLCKGDLSEQVIKAPIEDEKYVQVIACLKGKEPDR